MPNTTTKLVARGWSAVRYAKSDKPGRNGWLRRFSATFHSSDVAVPELELNTNENGEVSVSRKRRAECWVTVRTYPDGTVRVEHGETQELRRVVAIVLPPEYAERRA